MTATTAKTVNYTDEQTAMMVEQYVEAPTMETVEKLADTLGKTVKSIVAKLSREKVYIPKVYVRKDGTKAEKKDETADAIGKILNLSENEVESLTKATRSTLQKLFAALAKPVTEDTATK